MRKTSNPKLPFERVWKRISRVRRYSRRAFDDIEPQYETLQRAIDRSIPGTIVLHRVTRSHAQTIALYETRYGVGRRVIDGVSCIRLDNRKNLDTRFTFCIRFVSLALVFCNRYLSFYRAIVLSNIDV